VKEIQADFSLVPSAVEELLRTQIMGSSIGTLRYALVDIELSDGTVIKQGSSVLLSEESANMDETVFHDPFTLDIRRKENHHMTFGAGIHYCVGAALARMELQVATETLLRRFPKLRLAVPAEDLPRGLGGFMEGFSEIPVAW
jgi:cytochrome P450